MRAALLIAIFAAVAFQSPQPSALSENGLQPGLRPLPSITGPAPLSGLKPISDAAPQCRARCAQDRYSCSGDDDECADQWRLCVKGCTSAR